MLNRKQTKLDLGAGLYRYRVRYETAECEAMSSSGLAAQQSMFESVVRSPDLCRVGSGRFETLRLFHDGLRWVVELERQERETP